MERLALCGRFQLALTISALRHQLAILERSTKRPPFPPYAAAYLLQPLDGDAFAWESRLRQAGALRGDEETSWNGETLRLRHRAPATVRTVHGSRPTYRYVPYS